MGKDGVRSGVLVVRLWIEGNSPTELRARITASAGAGLADQPVAIEVTPEAISTAVRSWLQGFVAAGCSDFWIFTEP